MIYQRLPFCDRWTGHVRGWWLCPTTTSPGERWTGSVPVTWYLLPVSTSATVMGHDGLHDIHWNVYLVISNEITDCPHFIADATSL